MREAPMASWTRWLALSAAVVALDLATKAWITAVFRYGEVREVTPFFNLVLVHNKGAAFSFLADAGGWLRRHRAHRALSAALALVLGGALGNLYDRVTLGHVVDFVQLHAAGYYWPAFNVADSAISIGVVLLLWDSVRPGQDAAPAAQEKP